MASVDAWIGEAAPSGDAAGVLVWADGADGGEPCACEADLLLGMISVEGGSIDEPGMSSSGELGRVGTVMGTPGEATWVIGST